MAEAEEAVPVARCARGRWGSLGHSQVCLPLSSDTCKPECVDTSLRRLTSSSPKAHGSSVGPHARGHRCHGALVHKTNSLRGGFSWRVYECPAPSWGPFRGHESEDQSHHMRFRALWRVSEMLGSMARFCFCSENVRAV